jgi:hypothetical protein
VLLYKLSWLKIGVRYKPCKLGETQMSEQEQDFNSFQEHLERIFKDLEDGVFITADEIGDLRYACGLPSPVRKNPVLKAVFDDYSTIFGAKQ